MKKKTDTVRSERIVGDDYRTGPGLRIHVDGDTRSHLVWRDNKRPSALLTRLAGWESLLWLALPFVSFVVAALLVPAAWTTPFAMMLFLVMLVMGSWAGSPPTRQSQIVAVVRKAQELRIDDGSLTVGSGPSIALAKIRVRVLETEDRRAIVAVSESGRSTPLLDDLTELEAQHVVDAIAAYVAVESTETA